MSGCFFTLSILFFLIGLVQLLKPEPVRPAANTEDRSRWPKPEPHVTKKPDVSQKKENAMKLTPSQVVTFKVGQRLSVHHPIKGDLSVNVLGRIVYAELWQRSRGAQNPWVPTGNTYPGFWLEGGRFLLYWQNREYILDEAVEVSDADIQRDFAPYARQFAQSDQTADVYFTYPPAVWHIDDIGKFRVEQVEGEGFRFQPGAIGRFIHTGGDSGRALIVEDYEGGSSGQDTVWIGYKLASEADVRAE